MLGRAFTLLLLTTCFLVSWTVPGPDAYAQEPTPTTPPSLPPPPQERPNGRWDITYTTVDGLGSDYVRALWGDGEGRVWAGTYGGGVSVWDGARWQTYTTDDGLGSNDVQALWGDGEGRVWAGTDGGGVSVWDGARWQTYTTDEGLGSDEVQALWGDGEGRVWAGTWGDGVSVWDGARWQTYTTAEGLGSNDVRALWGDGEGRVWAGTDGGGVSVWDATQLDEEPGMRPRRWRTWLTFKIAQRGLGSDEIYAIAGLPNGEILFGTNSWYSRYRPSSPQIQLMAQRVDEASFYCDGTISSGTVNFEFAALHPYHAEQTAYRYKLERNGEPQLWSFQLNTLDEKQSAVTLDAGQPGHYVFSVMAGTTYDYAWSEPVMCAFTVQSEPPSIEIVAVQVDGNYNAPDPQNVSPPALLLDTQRHVEISIRPEDDVSTDLQVKYALNYPSGEQSTGQQTDPLLTFDLESGVYRLSLQAVDEENQLSPEVVTVLNIPPSRIRQLGPWVLLLVLVGVGGPTTTVLVLRRRRRRQARVTHLNPYVVGPPITEEKSFFGRRAELQRILGAVHNNHFLISGERRIGKTSLLRQVERRLREMRESKAAFCPWSVYFTLQGVPQERFYAALMRAILRETGLETSDLALARQDESYDDFDFEADLRRVVERLSAQAVPPLPLRSGDFRRPARLVLCLDELDALFAYPAAFREQLRAVVQAVDPSVRLVAAGVMAVEAEALRTSPFYNQFTRVEVRPLSRQEIERLVRQPAGDLYRFTDAAVDFIVQQSHGLPLEVQRLCHHAVNVMLDQDAPAIDLPQAQLAFERALADRVPEFQLIWWGGQDKETGLSLPPLDATQREALQEALTTDHRVPLSAYTGEGALFHRRQLYNLTYETQDGLRLTALFAVWMSRNVLHVA
jgi:hypothetical protein